MATKPEKYPEWANSDLVDPVSGKDNVAEPSQTEKDRGWDRYQIPPRQHFNWWQRLVKQWVQYFNEIGVPEWDAAQEYHTGSFTNRNGTLYVSQVADNVNNDPATDTVNWSPIEASQVGFTDPASLTDNVQSALAEAIRGDVEAVQGLIGALDTVGGVGVAAPLPAGVDTADVPTLWAPRISIHAVESGELQNQPHDFGVVYNLGMEFGGILRLAQLFVERTASASTLSRVYFRFSNIGDDTWQAFRILLDREPAARWAAGVRISPKSDGTVEFRDTLGRSDPSGWVNQDTAHATLWAAERNSVGRITVRPPSDRLLSDYAITVTPSRGDSAISTAGAQVRALSSTGGLGTILIYDENGTLTDGEVLFTALRVT